MSAVIRTPCPSDFVDRATSEAMALLDRRLRKHGPGVYAGPHETLGILVEEMDELRDAVRANDAGQAYAELADIAVGCLFGMASLRVTHEAAIRSRDDALAADTTTRGWLLSRAARSAV